MKPVQSLINLMVVGLLVVPAAAFAQQPVCTHPSEQSLAVGAGSDSMLAIAWRDDRDTSNTGIYAELFDWYGNPQWGTFSSGAPVCVAPNAQSEPVIALGPDQTTWLAWSDMRDCTSAQGDVYFQAIRPDGTPYCAINGLQATTGVPCNYRNRPAITAFEPGSAIVAFHRNVGTGFGQSQNRVFVQKLTSECGRLWGAEGSQVWSGGTVNNRPGTIRPQIIPDGLGGTIVVWMYDVEANHFVYVRRVDSNGVPQWSDAVRVCATSGTEAAPAIAPDGAGGVIVVWQQGNAGSRSIRAQRVDVLGTRQWGDCGVVICNSGGDLTEPRIARASFGRSFVVWQANYSASNSDLFCQRINLLGDTLGARIPVCVSPQAQMTPQVVGRTDGGCVIAWEDRRDLGVGDFGDVYIQRFDANGVALCTSNGERFGSSYPSRQSLPRLYGVDFGGSSSAPGGTAAMLWTDERLGSTDLFALGLADACPPGVLGVPSRQDRVMSLSVKPNPTSGRASVQYRLARPAVVSVQILDVAGRVVSRVMAGVSQPPGQQTLLLDDPLGEIRASRPGVYFVELCADGVHARAPIVVLR